LGRPTSATKPERCTSSAPAGAPPGFSSAVMVVLLVTVLHVVVLGPAHEHRGEPLASARGLLALELEAEGCRGGAGQRHPAGGLREQTAHAVDVVVIEIEVEQLPHLGEPGAGGHAVAALA